MNKVLFAALIVGALAVFVSLNKVEGVIVLPDFKDGVILCGNELEPQSFVHKDNFHLFVTKYGDTAIVNWGHMDDPKTETLVEYAGAFCNKFRR